MKIALDYDRTYTADKPFWNLFIINALEYGHTVVIATARSSTKDKLDEDNGFQELKVEGSWAHADYSLLIPICYLDGVAKKWALHHYFDFDPDIWIDDKPESILANSTASKEVLATWRANGRQ